MTEPISPAVVNATLSAYFETMTRLTEYLPGAYARQGDAGTRLIFTTIPVAELNAVWVGHNPDLDEVEAFAREISAAGVPWSIQIRGEVDPGLEKLANQYGRTVASSHPLLLWHAESLSTLPAATAHGAHVRKLSGAEQKLFAATLAEGFGMPEDIAGMLASPPLLDAPGITAFVLDLAGEAVATGLNVLAGDHAGMYCGSVPPRYRGNGYYRALVTARLADAVARGARHAFSLNTPMSRPLFEAVGFRRIETWTYLAPAIG
jgi:GNAT superfamily N-acetyltransferase